mmetsp:Transcript_35157/g.110672  ORF Transcript_35157/g.110672 Transcript_35157/m.110672 type:complete len:203 (-) Transcript_35157:881-1489(-)
MLMGIVPGKLPSRASRSLRPSAPVSASRARAVIASEASPRSSSPASSRGFRAEMIASSSSDSRPTSWSSCGVPDAVRSSLGFGFGLGLGLGLGSGFGPPASWLTARAPVPPRTCARCYHRCRRGRSPASMSGLPARHCGAARRRRLRRVAGSSCGTFRGRRSASRARPCRARPRCPRPNPAASPQRRSRCECRSGCSAAQGL